MRSTINVDRRVPDSGILVAGRFGQDERSEVPDGLLSRGVADMQKPAVLACANGTRQNVFWGIKKLAYRWVTSPWPGNVRAPDGPGRYANDSSGTHVGTSLLVVY